PEIFRADALARAAERARRGDPEPTASDAAVREAVAFAETWQYALDATTYGIFLANVLQARNVNASESVRTNAIEQLVPLLRPDFRAYKGRLYPAAQRRFRKLGGLEKGDSGRLTAADLTW